MTMDGDPTGGLPAVSVVVATRGRPDLLGPLIRAVLGDCAVAEMIVVVDGDDTASMSLLHGAARRLPRLVPMSVQRNGQLAALDAGVARARSEVVLLLDDDVLPVSALAAGHARHHRDRDDLVVVGSMPVWLPPGERPTPPSALYAKEYDNRCRAFASGEANVLDYLWGGNVSVRRRDCTRVGLYSPAFPFRYHADQELGFRLADAGLDGVYDPSLAALHLHRRTNAAFLRDARRQGAGMSALCRAYPARPGTRRDSGNGRGLRAWSMAALRAGGASPAAGAIAGSVMWGGAMLQKAGVPGAGLGSARLARRIMQLRGAAAGEGRGERLP